MSEQKPDQNRKNPQQPRRKSPWILGILLLGWSLLLGIGMAQAIAPQQTETLLAQSVDPVPSELQLAAQVYVENCGSCHLALPPEVLPTETWRNLLQNPDQHYGAKLPTIIRPEIYLMWQYLQTFSRPHQDNETIPFRVAESRYFKALHPKVEFAEPVTYRTCINCHYRANEYNFRLLTPEWNNSP